MLEASTRQIEVFRMVMRLGSANRAAAALHVSQPAVTQILQQLELRSELKLFDRPKGKLMPTPEAHALMEEVERVYEGLETVQRKIMALRSHEDAVLRIGSLHAMAASVIPWALTEFQRSYPRTRCLLSVDSSIALRDALFQGAVDLAFLGDEADTGGLVSSVFYEVPAVCVMPAAHPLARRPQLGAADLRDIALVGLAASDPAQRRLEAAFAQAGIQPRFVIETPYSATQCSLVLAGAGLAVTNPLVAREYVAMGLRCVHFVAGVSFRALLAFKPRQAQSGAAQEFVALCRRYLSNGLPAGPVPDTP
ncbi:MAG: LysR family transcriptional regulator [Polaromonas sp.]|uniref:LysR substrate-binding domain-containing protein n=1 Tax=Polaromonas sp. TaxID=1869339 RepID=UPI00182D8939|nr:LysR substrate-binding domain-containing protein [Polaromonas sp.]MBA3592695.1 LysR family transcriptional regulator [Polaromonas sp.]